jgi:thiol:disulfide interchange protein DsbC
MKKLIPQALVASLILLLSFSLVGAADESMEEMTRLLKLRLGTDQVEPATATSVEGVYQTRFGDKFAYLIEGGRYVFIGDMVDLENAHNLTEMSRRELVVEELASFDEKKTIVFPAENQELAVLNVFTDTSCGYCQQLHKEVKYLQEAGISVH